MYCELISKQLATATAGEEASGDGDGSSAPRGESCLLRCARPHRLPCVQAQDCPGAEGEAHIQGGAYLNPSDFCVVVKSYSNTRSFL